MVRMNSHDINRIVFNAANLRHGLVLCGSHIDKYALHTSFLTTAKKNEKVIYVTNDNPESVVEKFNGLVRNSQIIKPDKLNGLKSSNKQFRIIFDAASLDKEDHMKYEKCLSEKFKANSFILCGYDITKINPDDIKELVAYHDKLTLMTSDVSILSSESFDKLGITDESVEQLVKNDLKMIVFALLMNNPMSGTDIIKTVHKNFNVLLSPGTIYPLLHSLEKKGFVQCEYAVKKKIYRVADNSLHEVKSNLDEHIRTSTAMSGFLLSAVREIRGKR